MVEWLLWFVSYINKPEYALRAERPVPAEHEEDREGKL